MRPSTLAKPMRKPQQRANVVQTMAAPVGGLDSVSPIALMPEANAVEMDNFLSVDNGVTVRQGWYEYATGFGLSVRTVMSYDAAPLNAMVSALSESELFAATDDGIWLIEGGGDFTTEPADIALTGANFAGCMQSVQFTTNGGNFLVACSETDGGFIYNGATWARMATTGGPGPGIITGTDPADFVQVVAFKHRLGFVQRQSSVAWFLPVDSVGGEALPFDFGPVLQHGGTLLALVNWTQDGGQGVDDRLVVLGSAGDLAVYQGTDPTDPTAFALVGVWYVGQPPVGRRQFTTSGANCYVMTQQGLLPVGLIVQGGLDTVETSDTAMLQGLRRIQDQLARDFESTLYMHGWELVNLPAKAAFLIVRPRSGATDWVQYAFARHSNAWARLLDIPVSTVAVRLNEVYGGTEDGRVLRLLDGYSDAKALDGSGAVHIRARLTPAFSYFGAPDVVKQALMVRAVFLAKGAVSYLVRMNADYYVPPGTLTPVETDPTGALWDHAIWNRDRWAPGLQGMFEWRSVEGMGYALAPTLFVSAKGRVILNAIEYMIRPGGSL